MKIIDKSLFAVIAMTAMAVSCTKEPSQKVDTIGAVTGAAINISFRSAELSGKAIPPKTTSANLTFGILFSTSSDILIGSAFQIQARSFDSECNYSVNPDVLEPATTYYYRAYISQSGEISYGEVKSFKTLDYPIPDLVDLGLSVKWATCNLGAASPEEYGCYYQWAGTQDVTIKNIYLDWRNCPYHTGSSNRSDWTKYVPSGQSSYWSGSGSPDNKTVLEPEDDVAHVKLEGKWRIPTDAEWAELISNCVWTQIRHNGVKGYQVTSKKSGYTDKSIFLPAAGSRNHEWLYNEGSCGWYWSSSLNTSNPNYASFLNSNTDRVETEDAGRGCGLSVRPVCE